MDRAWEITSMQIYSDHRKEMKIEKEEDFSREIQALDEEGAEKAFTSDKLKLASDCAGLQRLARAQQVEERNMRAAKVNHLRTQNQIGAQLVNKFMNDNVAHVLGPMNQIQLAVSQATCHFYGGIFTLDLDLS